MKRILYMAIQLLTVVVFLTSCGEKKMESKVEETTLKSKKPNIIYILADDLGYGDLGVYGQEKIKTPHLDKFATRGIRFTQHYSGSTVCAPSRSSLMTGLHTGHTPIRGNRELEREGQTPLPASAFTIAELMKNSGYKTGAFGKWGLGFIGSEGDPNKQGFDEFYGYNCQRMAHRYYPPYLWHNQDSVFLKGNDWSNTVTYAPDKIQEATLDFISEHKNEPFFAYVPLVLPHAELISPKDSIYAMYKDKFEENKPFQLPHDYLSDYGPDMVPHKYVSTSEPHAIYATMVTRLDAYVGQIIDHVEKLGLSENTLIIFTSDNGPAVEGGADPSFFSGSGGLRGFKRDLYEGGIRAPFIAVWPNRIKENTVSDHISSFWDMMPTFAHLIDAEVPAEVDGVSFLPTLLSKGEQQQHDYLYWEFHIKGGRQAVRKGNWKAVLYSIKEDPNAVELYNLSTDIAEEHDVAKENPEVVAEMVQIMKEAHVASELFPLTE